jgi:hypothetical protein
VIRRRAPAVALSALALTLVLGNACSPIVAEPLSHAPVNSGCPDVNTCDRYIVPNVTTKAQCNKGSCDFGRPDYAFKVVVNVPDSSFFAPGRTFVLSNTDLAAQPGLTTTSTCKPPSCVQLPPLVIATGKYRTTTAASTTIGLPLAENTSLPVRVSFVKLLDDSPTSTSVVEVAPLGIPLEPFFTSSRFVRATTTSPEELSYFDAVTAGRYLRIAYPEPPYDEMFPPAIGPVTERDGFFDDFVLGAKSTPLDDDTDAGDARRAFVSRAEGLDGWKIWLVDGTSQRRISNTRTLSGRKTDVRLDTVGQSVVGGGSRALRDAEVIVAPPDGWLGVPLFQSALPNGQGLEAVDIPSFPGPASVTGVVASGDGTLTGVPSKLLFTSTGLRRADGKADTPLLRYSAAVATDETGHFATVLPPGRYDVTIEPAEGTGFAKVKATFDTSDGLAKTYLPPLRTLATGRVVLADGRPLAEADILALPADRPVVGTPVRPRPARARTDREGGFSFQVDQGQFDLVVDPQAGTGFPRVTQARSFGTGTADIGEIVVPPPARLAFTLRDPLGNNGNGNPMVGAMVRVFAEAPGRGPPAVEIGRATTNTKGEVEILLAPQPR